MHAPDGVPDLTPGEYLRESGAAAMTWETTWADLFPREPSPVLLPFYGHRPVVPRSNTRPEPDAETLAARSARDARVATNQAARTAAKAPPSPAAKDLAAEAKAAIAKRGVPMPPAPSAALARSKRVRRSAVQFVPAA